MTPDDLDDDGRRLESGWESVSDIHPGFLAAPLASSHHSSWLPEMLGTWLLAAGGLAIGIEHVLQGILAAAAVAASCVSAFVGYRKYTWERADRARWSALEDARRTRPQQPPATDARPRFYRAPGPPGSPETSP